MIHVGAGKRLRVLAVVPVEEEDSLYVGLLRVEAAAPKLERRGPAV
jgi:hypothetical protein